MKQAFSKRQLILWTYILSLSLILAVFHFRRIASINKKTVELNRVRGEIEDVQNRLFEMESYRKRLISRPQTMAYVEFLYRTAGDTRLKFHEVITDNSQRSADKNAAFTSSRLKITVKGNFRSVAEYIRTILNQQQLSRITELKIATDQNSLVGNINIEIFSYK